jgi:methylmalonyl-CoA/ethylmalonyl-CoA epimerase
VTGVHHVAIAHGDDQVCEEALMSLVGPPSSSEEAPGFIERMYQLGGAAVQTLEATGDGVVQRFLDKRGPGLHHIAFEVDRIDDALSDLADRGVPLIDTEARQGGLGTRIGFLHPSALGGVLVELVEESHDRGVSRSDEEGPDGRQ